MGIMWGLWECYCDVVGMLCWAREGLLRDIWGYYGSVVWGVGGVLWEAFWE